jgi:hypothetical protein
MVEARHSRPRLSKESGALMILHTLVFSIAQLLCEDMETLGQLSAYEPLVTFEREQQELKPYGVVWVNSDSLDLLES